MKIVDLSCFDLIKEGIEFVTSSNKQREQPLEELLPCIERNESAVYWLQPKGGTVDQQEACICVNGMFYALNSAFEKAIFRSVRLTRDFQNYERLVDGTPKLVIPRRLFQNMDLMKRLGCRKKSVFKTPLQKGMQGPLSTKQSKMFSATEAPAVTAPAVTTAATAPDFAEQKSGPIFQELRLLTNQMKDKKPVLQTDRKRRKNNVEFVKKFEIVNQALQQPEPKLFHTPHSLLTMLFEVFCLDFPDSLPQDHMAQLLLAVQQ